MTTGNDGEGGSKADAPLLMLDTGGHMARIESIAFTPDGKQLVSASGDKTIRVWDLATGKTVRTLRGETAAGDPGETMALSPDGKWLAAGGWMPGTLKESSDIRLYEFGSGKLVALLRGHENIVFCLAFSPDGRQLISGSADFTAILWDVETRQLKHRLRGHSDCIYALGFTPDGACAVTASYDCDLRLWRVADGEEIAHMRGHADKVRSLVVTSDGAIVSGDKGGEIRLWDGSTGAFRRVLARQGTAIGSLSVNQDGTRLLSGAGGIPLNCCVYDLASGRKIATYSGHDNIVVATAICPNGRWAATGGGNNHEIHLWDLRTGERHLGPDGQPLTLGGQGRPVWAVGLSVDGRRITWGNAHRLMVEAVLEPFHYVISLPSEEMALPSPQRIRRSAIWWGRAIFWWAYARKWLRANREFCRAIHELNGWSLSLRKDVGLWDYTCDKSILDVKHKQHLVTSIKWDPADGSEHRSYSFTSDGETIVSGGAHGVLTAYSRAGDKLGDFVGHLGDVLDVAPSPDSRVLVSGAGDQTVRLWNLKTRELLVTLFHGADAEWVMWTPQGYYISSPDGDKYVGWQINHGPENAADYVRASQLSERLFRPDIIARTIELASAKAALRDMGEALDITDLLRVSRPPEFRILLPEGGAKVPDTPASIVVEAYSNPDPLHPYEIIVNGRQVATRDFHAQHDFGSRPARETLRVPLEKGRNDIRIVARNRVGTAERDLLLHFLGRGKLDQRGALYVVAVGVDEYTNAKHKALRFAGADARAFCETMLRHVAPLHERAECLLLAKGGDLDPTCANIQDAMLLFRKAELQDTVVLFLAGHGVNDGQNYLFLPQDVHGKGEHYQPSTVVPWLVFQAALHGASGRRLMFVDTCYASGAYNARLVKDAHDARIIVFSATDSETQALELERLGHGAFTYALIQGLAGAADPQRDGEVELFALQSYISREVRNLTNRRQSPAIHLSGVTDFVIARK